TGSNASGYSAALPDQVMTITYTAGSAPRSLLWTGTAGQDLGSALNWNDVTHGLDPATLAPGSTDSVEFGTGAGRLTGSGTAATATFDGNGAWQLAAKGTLASLGTIGIGVTSASSVSVTDGAELSGSGALTVGRGASGF